MYNLVCDCQAKNVTCFLKDKKASHQSVGCILHPNLIGEHGQPKICSKERD